MVGYQPCACRDCFEIAIGEPGALCSLCQDAGCAPCTCGDAKGRAHARGFACDAYNPITRRHEECHAPGAYGGDE